MASKRKKLSEESKEELLILDTFITREIMMCDTPEDVLVIASCLISIVKRILDQQVGEETRKQIFKVHS
jgi:hypothetical protein